MAKKQWKSFAHPLSGLTFKVKATRSKPKWLPAFAYRWFVRPLPRLRLSHQLLGFFVLVVLVPLLLLTLSIYGINQKAVRKQVNHFTAHTAEITFQELAWEMNWQQDQARLVAEYWKMVFSLPQAQERQARARQFFVDYPEYEAVAFYDTQGHRKSFVRSFQPRYTNLDLPLDLPNLPQDVTFDLHHHREHARDVDLVYSLKITIPGPKLGGSKPVGAVVFQKRFPYLGHLIADRFKTLNTGFAIADAQGVIIAGPPTMVSKKLPPEDLKVYRSLKEGSSQEFSSNHHYYSQFPMPVNDDEDPTLEKVVLKMPRLGWGIIIESPYHLQTTYVNRARTQSVALVFLCILLIIVLGLLYSRGINRNFRQLIKGIKALAEGRYSRKIRLITKSWTPYEIVYLTAEFNRMATKISSAWTNIQELNQELVHKNLQDMFIAQATQRLHSNLELSNVCQTAATLFTERPGILGSLLYLAHDAEHQEFCLMAYAGKQISEFVEPQALTLESRVVLNLPLASRGGVITVTASDLPGLLTNTLATLQPIYYQDQVLGVVVLLKANIREDKDAIHFDDAMMMKLLTGQIGVAIYQSRQWEQLQLANIQLSKLDELKSNLIDTVSHELRTPLTNIKGYTSRLIRYEDTLDSDTKIKSLKVIKQQADRLGRLVEDLLVIPELEREEGIRVYPDRVDINELMHRCIGFIGDKANREITIAAMPEGIDVLVDPDRMEQVILNLLDNAIKYSPEGEAIDVSVRESRDNTVEIQIFNHCEPISPDALGSLFTKFKRLDERLTRTTRGTGLGLFITKGLVEAMGGKIWLEGHDGFRVFLLVPIYGSDASSSDSETSVSIEARI